MLKDNRSKIIYFFSTGLLTIMMISSVYIYFFKFEETAAPSFEALGFPLYIIYPLAIAKLLGLIAIWSNRSFFLKHLAYSGFFFNFLLALIAHIYAADNKFTPALIAIILLWLSYSSYRCTLTKEGDKCLLEGGKKD